MNKKENRSRRGRFKSSKQFVLFNTFAIFDYFRAFLLASVRPPRPAPRRINADGSGIGV